MDEQMIAKQRANSSDYFGREGSEFKSFGVCLKWVFVDQSSIWRTGLSWSVFFVLAIGVPLVSHFLLACSDCDANHSRPYHVVSQLSLSLFSVLAFVSLSIWTHRYGLRKFLFLDGLYESSEKVRHGYKQHFQNSMKLLCLIVIPCFVLECVYKIWWYVSGASELPYYGNIYLSNSILCMLELISWLYRTTIFFLVCVLFRLVCHLQILRLQNFAQVFQEETEVELILMEHLKIRRNLRSMSHRFRIFILFSLIMVTASQLTSLVLVTRSSAHVNISKAGELALCSISLVTSLFICLRSATKITHKAQSITGLATKWHVCATLHSFDYAETETPMAPISSTPAFPFRVDMESEDEEGVEDDDLDNTKLVPIYSQTISFQKRQSLVTYLENNRAGITVFGFTVDRMWLHSIFAIQLALLLWLLNKTLV
ncbi:hypothetical protein D8674_001877 [Pyrus ussuriensis x Pyrus communis]|uniref:Uncharacterized protein n=1 Tax=Pyrus ussuriensis x Pyrus communis TaxID=2448454 RepID=A0A5N5FI48_9ROSA|nr:hypothetical protein D8674_001877 [Pyrus ussuriensis x Pyrus communis]